MSEYYIVWGPNGNGFITDNEVKSRQLSTGKLPMVTDSDVFDIRESWCDDVYEDGKKEQLRMDRVTLGTRQSIAKATGVSGE